MLDDPLKANLREIQQEVERVRASELDQRNAFPEQYDELRARQAAAHTREDMFLLCVVQMHALKQLVHIKLSLFLIAAILAAKFFF